MAAVCGRLGPEMAAPVSHYQPDQFIADLEALPPVVPQPIATRPGGCKTKRPAPKLSPKE